MLTVDQTKAPFSQSSLAANTLPWTSERFSRRPVGANFRPGLRGLGDDIGSYVDIPAFVQGIVDSGTNAVSNAIQQDLNKGSNADPVPMQNTVLNTVLAPVSNALGMTAVQTSVSALQALASFLNAGQAQWNAWLQAHPSSRATGAQNTLAPYFQRLNLAIQTYLGQMGATVPVIPGTGIPLQPGIFGSMSTTTLLLLGVGAYLLLRR
jgi:hypothetical protein